MKTISFFFAISGLLFLAVSVSYATTTVDPQLYPLHKKQSAIFQVPQVEEDKVLIKFKNEKENTLMEVEVETGDQENKLFNFSRLQQGTYYMDVFHNGIITRKELLLRWDGIYVVDILKMDREPIPDSYWNWWF